MATETIERAAIITTNASIGHLYDARTDNFCGVSIFKEGIPQDSLFVTDCSSFDVSIVQGDGFYEKLNKLGVKVDQYVSLLAGLTTLEPSIDYALERNATTITIKSSLNYQIKTKEEWLTIDPDKLGQYFCSDHLENIVGTHVVTGISWGANLILSLSSENTNNEDVEMVEEKLTATLEKIKTGSFNAADGIELGTSQLEPVEVKMYSDILTNTEECTTTLQSAVEHLKDLPDLVKNLNEGKGQQLTYQLTPIKFLQDKCNLSINSNVAFNAIDNTTNIHVVQLFDQLTCIKQQLNEFQKYWYCVTEKDKEIVNNLVDELNLLETNVKSMLLSVLVNVRSGKSDVAELNDQIKEFSNCAFQKPEEFLDRNKCLLEKINFARQLVFNGVKYIGIGASPEDELLRHVDDKTFVIYFTKSSCVGDNARWIENKRLFLQQIKEKNQNEQYFAADCDIHPNLMPKASKNHTYIRVLQAGRVITEDLLEENSKVQVIPRAQSTQITEKFPTVPKTKIPLAIPCVGISCKPEPIHNWACKNCGEIFQYGFDFHVYCLCGKSLASSLEFKCPDVKHGPKFQMHSEVSHLNQLLGQLQPMKDVNILILGETGVGKSTWINGFVNYLKYGSLEEAQVGKLLTLIPSEFTVCNPTPTGFEQIVVQTGQDENEEFKAGQSATQSTKVYPIPIGDTTVRLIDTPGIGDTRGIDQDKRNFQNILTTLSHLEELHGICILLKPNSARLTIMFRFCIKELLTYLHRDASKNIVFGFTNSRSTLYKPGDTFPALNTLLKENKEVEIIVSPNTVYCYDSCWKRRHF